MIRKLTCGMLLGSLLLVSTGAQAHKGLALRSLNLEVTDSQLVVLVHLKITGERQRQALQVVADANRDGQLSQAERDTLRDSLASRALSGLKLQVGSSTVTLSQAQSRLQMNTDGPVEVMVHGVAPFGTADFQVTLRTTARAEGLAVRTVPGPRKLKSASRGRPARSGLYEAQMGPGDELKLTFE